MADEDKKEKAEEADDKVSMNPDLEKETEGMVDLSDVLASGDNETGAASAEDALQEHTEKSESEEVDLFEKKVEDESDSAPAESKPNFFQKVFAKIFPEESYQRWVLDKVSKAIGIAFLFLKSQGLAFKDRSIVFVKEDSKVILANALEKIKSFIQVIVDEIKNFFSLSWKLKVLFVFIVLMIGVIFVFVQKAVKGDILPEVEDPYVFNFNQVADEVYDIAKDDKWEKFRNPIRYPEYVVRFDRIIVMLKPSVFSSKNSMGVFSLFFETSSQEAATELKDREAEVRDVTARTLEEVEFDEIRSPEGKKKSKKLLIQAINKILNQGKVVKVYYKDLIVSP